MCDRRSPASGPVARVGRSRAAGDLPLDATAVRLLPRLNRSTAPIGRCWTARLREGGGGGVPGERGRGRPRAAADRRSPVRAPQRVGRVQPSAEDENAYLARHTWDEYSAWHLGLTEGANDSAKARYALSTATSAACTAWGSSPAITAPRNGVTRRSSSSR